MKQEDEIINNGMGLFEKIKTKTPLENEVESFGTAKDGSPRVFVILTGIIYLINRTMKRIEYWNRHQKPKIK